MTCRGHIHRGTIVLDHSPDLPEGMAVEVEIKPAAAPPNGVRSIRDLAGEIAYDFDALDRLREASKL